MPQLQSVRRRLTPSERRLLNLRILQLESRHARTSRMLIMGAVVIVALWLTTLVTSDAASVVITAFWLLVGAALLVWILKDVVRERRDLDAIIASHRSALRANQADVFKIAAHAFVEFEEVEDEGACYAFGLDERKSVFVAGQEFYPSAKFPSLDFDIVHVLNEHGRTIAAHLQKRGQSVAAREVVSAARKDVLDLPEHLEVVHVPLEDLEGALGRAV